MITNKMTDQVDRICDADMAILRSALGPRNHDEYVQALMAAQTHINVALATPDPAVARRALSAARSALGSADTRLSAHAAPTREPGGSW
jgi:hypothetical protein